VRCLLFVLFAVRTAVRLFVVRSYAIRGHVESWIPTHPFTNAVLRHPLRLILVVQKSEERERVNFRIAFLIFLLFNVAMLPPFVVMCAPWHPLFRAICLYSHADSILCLGSLVALVLGAVALDGQRRVGRGAGGWSTVARLTMIGCACGSMMCGRALCREAIALVWRWSCQTRW